MLSRHHAALPVPVQALTGRERLGTSGGPFLAGFGPGTGEGTVAGVIGGYEQGGDIPAASYSAVFGPAVRALYETAVAGG